MSSQIEKMGDDEKKELKERLLRTQGNVCFLCGNKINLDADETQIDHIKPRSDGGPDEESNWALMHAHCNNKKRAKNLELARALMKFENLREKYSGAITSGDILMEFGGSTKELYMEDYGQKVLVRYEDQGETIEYETSIIIDPNNPSYRSFFATLPIEVLYHDKELNPRKVIDIDKLIEEFWRKNPQLHVSLARVHIPERGRGKVLLFDGQHKTAAQIVLGNRYIPTRVFLNPDKENLKETNRRAHKELRQVEFFRSVLDTLGQDIFSVHFRKYLENTSSSPKSEKGYIDSVEADRRSEEKRNLYHSLKAMVRDSQNPKNKFFDYVEMEAPRSRTWPLSYNSVEKTFFRYFIDSSACEIAVDTYDENPDEFPRNLERKNLISLMNLFAEETLEGKFDKNIGVFKLEDRIRRGDTIPDGHLRAYRLYRPAVFQVWCELFQEAFANYFLMRGKLTKDMKEKNRVLWIKIDDEEWQGVRKMCKKLVSHKIWIDRGEVISNAFGQTRPDYFKKLLEQGIIDGVGKVLEQPINVQFIASATWK